MVGKMDGGSENGLLPLCSEALSRHLFGAPVSHLHPLCIRDSNKIYHAFVFFCFVFVFVLYLYLFWICLVHL